MIQISNLSGSSSITNYAEPNTAAFIVGQLPIPGYVRQIHLSPNGVLITNGNNTVAYGLQDLVVLAILTGDIGLGYAPYFSTQPVNTTVTHPAATSFTVVVSSDITVTYQWQISTNGGSTWSNVTNTGVYTGALTATLNISNSTGLTGNQYRCQATNTLGTTTSTPATLTVL